MKSTPSRLAPSVFRLFAGPAARPFVRQTLRPAALICAALLSGAPARAAGPTPNAAPQQAVVDAETQFAAMVAKFGVRDGFLETLASNALLLRPAPVNGPNLLQGEEPDSRSLRWAPERVIVAGSADLALSLGPFAGAPSAVAPVDSQGHFVSVWRVGDDGQWKLLLDAAMPHGDGASAVDAVAGLPLLPWTAPAGSCDANALGAAERRVVDARAAGDAPSPRLYAADAVVLRADLAPVAPGSAPRAGKRWGDAQMRATWVSKAQDLAVMTGLIRADGIDRGYGFVHAWTCDGGGWKLKLDLENLPR